MRNYISIGPKYQWHFTVEEDRPWLEETFVNLSFTADYAIRINNDLNESLDSFSFSRIFSDIQTCTNILWVSERVQHGKKITKAGAIHPTYGNMNLVRDIGEEDLNWLTSINRWNLETITFTTGREYSAGEKLFPERGFSDSITDYKSKSSRLKI